jgi:RecJ-like exonuclease
MKCPKCDGTGEMQICEMGFIGKDECDKCHGKGYLNNDEWRKTCSAEEFAKLLSDAMWYGEQCATEGVLCENCKCPWCKGIGNWLKQPHEQKGD